jgi:exodeoxyribonuclease V gamma subunit
MTRRNEPGIHLYQGNRLERLASILAEALRESAFDPLASEVVLVPHPGMAQWLKMRLADTLGIAANIEFPLPAVWLGQRAAAGVTQADALAWGRDALTWRLFDLRGDGFGPLSRRTDRGGDEQQRLARWQLAGQVAQGFERYLLQRPDWLRAWCEGRPARTGLEGEAWQMRTWQHLFASASAAQQRALRQRLDPVSIADQSLPEQLFAFGFASLPRLLIEDMKALGTRIPVHLFFPNPCRWYWGDLLAEREQLSRSRRLQYKPGLDADAEGHPVLASFGTVGRDFLHELYDAVEPVSEWEVFEEATASGLLAQVQNSLLDLEPALPAWHPDDRSVRFLIAPNPRRELEALHDILLALLGDSALGLRPHEIVVMAPKLSDYAPIIDAVFGAQPEGRRIPWQVTDLSEMDRHPLIALFFKLADLPVWRFNLSDILDALAIPAFASRFDIGIDELPRLSTLLEEAGVRWGLDGDFRSRIGAGDSEAFTIRFAVDRLIAGWLLGEDVDYADGIAPFAALRGSDVDLLGRFIACIDALDRWRLRLLSERTLGEWASTFSELCADCFQGSADDEDTAVLLRLTNALARWRQRSVLPVSATVVVPRRVVRESVIESLRNTAVSALPGEGVNFCAMVPLRGLPFRVVVLLGLGEGDFPRHDRELPDDLCRLRPHPGDRSLSAEDRYLFLEAVVSARDCLILSRVDRDPEHGLSREPSSVLADFTDYLRSNIAGEDQETFDRHIERVAWLPTDARHFTTAGAGDHVRSLAGEWLAPAPAVPPSVSLSDDLPIEWGELRCFFLDPARTQLQWRGVNLDPGQAPTEDAEPFDLDPLSAYEVRGFLVETLLRGGSPPAASALFERLQAAGMLPASRAGWRAFDSAFDDAAEIFERYSASSADRQLGRFEGWLAFPQIHGMARIDAVDSGGLLRWTAGSINGKRRMSAWLDLLALSLLREKTGLTAVLVGNDERAAVIRSPDQPLVVLDVLIEVWRRARREALPIYPKTSTSYVEKMSGKGSVETAIKHARAIWFGDRNNDRPGERMDPACAELARCFARFDEHPFEELALQVYGPAYGVSPA